MGTVTVNLAGLAGNTGFGTGIAGSRGDGKEQVKNSSIYAGNINNMTNDRIEQKRSMARKQATKALMDQFGADNKVTDKMDELRARNKEVEKEISDALEMRQIFVDDREALKGKYGISSDSEEQKQLDTIRKVRKARKTADWSEVSEEELKWVASMDKTQLTEYQQRALGYDEVVDYFDEKKEKLEREIRANNYGIREMKQGLLETSYRGITKAYKVADKILEAASKDIIGMVWEDAKKHVEEEFEKLVEAAKERAEKKEEQEEKLESAKEEKEEQKELVETIQDGAKEQEKLQKEIEKIVKDAELLEEDMKGILVDGLL